MAALKLFHNPRCSKSRQALALLEEKGAKFEIVEYLKDAPSASTIAKIIASSDSAPADFVRSGDVSFKDAGLTLAADADARTVADLVAAHPSVLQRPILVSDTKAVIGRPPEDILELL